MPTQTSYSQAFALPSRDELAALGLTEQEIERAIELWEPLVAAYLGAISGEDTPYQALQGIAPIAAEALAASLAGAYGERAFELPESVKQTLNQMAESAIGRAQLEMGKLRKESMRDIREAYSKALGPGYETSTPYRQAVEGLEAQIQPVLADLLARINEQYGQQYLQNLQHFTALKQQQPQLAAAILNNLASQQNTYLDQLQSALNMLKFPTQMRMGQAGLWAPYGIQQQWSRGGVSGRKGGGVFSSALGGFLSGIGAGASGPIGEAIGKILGGIF